MTVFWCKKHLFCPINGTLEHCLAQNGRQGCIRLIKLPTEKPVFEHMSDKQRARIERRSQKRQLELIRRNQNG